MLVGGTDQVEYNYSFWAAWFNGIIYVNRQDKKSRHEAISKMERILQNGSSILLYPEGGWNNTENLLIQPLFAGPWLLAQKTGAEVVPISVFNEVGSRDVYVSAGKPISMQNLNKEQGLALLRDTMAGLQYEIMIAHTPVMHRCDIEPDGRFRFMTERKNEYLQVKWSRDVWEEELTFYHNKRYPLPVKVRESLKSVHTDSRNA